MVAAASEVSADLLRLAMTVQPTVTARDAVHECLRGTHSRVADGRLLCWDPWEILDDGGRAPDGPRRWVALDAEQVGARPPRAIARLAGDPDATRFWWLWTRAEARAKIRDVPILTWLRTTDWQSDGDIAAADAVGLRVALPHRGAGPDAAVAVNTRVCGDLMISWAAAQEPRP